MKTNTNLTVAEVVSNMKEIMNNSNVNVLDRVAAVEKEAALLNLFMETSEYWKV